tara:strand:+ start:1363 stop:2517 length:1155 start_codon:yes stop_codon:yes gene_type:complete
MPSSPKVIILIILLVVFAGLVSTKFIRSSGGDPLSWKSEWSKTNFEKTSINFSEILSGGPPKDGIPSIDKPSFVSFPNANEWLKPNEPVVAIEINGNAKAYPIQIIIWHEIVNDEIKGIPLTVTFCPLCNSSIVFDRRLEFKGKSFLFDFGTTGKLRNSDLVMYDRQTETWWQQFVGTGIVGELTGAKLKVLPSFIISYANFKESYPNGKVLSKKTGHLRSYGKNPYVGYDDINNTPFLLQNAPDNRLPPMERIINVSLNGINKIYPFSTIQKEKVVHDKIGKTDLVIFHLPGTSSALDKSSIAGSREIGAATVFESELNGKQLSFKRKDGVFVDEQTKSLWNITGKATKGSLIGKQLNPIIHGNHFAFAWLAFIPDSQIYGKE